MAIFVSKISSTFDPKLTSFLLLTVVPTRDLKCFCGKIIDFHGVMALEYFYELAINRNILSNLFLVKDDYAGS